MSKSLRPGRKRPALFRAWSLEGYDRDFRLFIFVMSATLAQPAILVTLTKEMAQAIPYVSEIRQIGDVSAIGRIAMAMAAVLWASLGERYSRKGLLIAGGVLNVFPYLLAIVAPNYPVFFMSLVVSFVGQAAFIALSPTIVMDMIPRTARGEALSVMGLATLSGAALGTVLPSFMVDRLSWQAPMLIVGLYGLAGWIALFFIRFPRRGAQERPLDGLPDSPASAAVGLNWPALLRVFQIRSNLSFVLYLVVLQFSMGGIGYYIFTILKAEYGMSAPMAMLLVMGAQSLTMIGTGFWGPRADEAVRRRLDGRIRTLLVGSVLATIFQALAYLALPAYRIKPWLIVGYIIFSAIASFASGSALTPLLDTMVGDTNPVELRALAISIRKLIAVLAGGLGILVMGWLQEMQGTFTWGTIILSGVALFSVPFLLPALKSVPQEMAALEPLAQPRAPAQSDEALQPV